MQNVLLIFFLYLSFSIQGQVALHRNLTEKNGLPSNYVYGIEQDEKGYIWLTTENGIVKYNGINFTPFTTQSGLPTNFSWKIFKDQTNRLWLHNNLTPFTFIQNDSIHRWGPKIDGFKLRNIKEDENRIYFNFRKDSCLMTNKSLTDFHFQKGTFLGKLNGVPYWSHSANVYQGKISEEFLLISIDPKNKPKILDSKQTQDKIYVLTALYLIVISENNVEQVPISSLGIKKAQQIEITKHGQNTIWISNHKKFVILDSNLKIIDASDRVNPTNEIHFSDVTLDLNADLWISTLGNGVINFPNNRNWIETIDEFTLGTNNIKNVEFISDHELAIFDNQQNAFIYNLTTKKTKTLEQKLNHLNPIGKHLLGAGKSGTYIYNQSMFVEESIYNNHHFKQIKNEGDSILISSIVGAEVLSRKNNEFKLTRYVYDYVYDFEFLNDSIYFGREYGLFVKNINHSDSPRERKILDKSVKIIHKVSDNELLIGLENGQLLIFNANNQTVSDIAIHDLGSPTDIAESKNTIFISSTNGLFALDKSTLQLINIPRIFNGFKNTVVNKLTINGNNLALATSYGAFIVPLKQLFVEQSAIIQPSYLKDVFVNGQHQKLSFLKTLKSNENRLKLVFETVSFYGHENIQYHYRLNGINPDWDSTSIPIIEYSNIPYGEYSFEMFISDNGVKIENSDFLIPIQKSKPLWLRSWFIVLISFGIALIGFFLLRNYFQRRNEKTLLSHELLSAEYKALRMQMNPHFIFNSFNSVQNSLLENNIEEANDYLSEISEFMRKVLNQSNQNTVKLDDSFSLIRQYVAIESKRLQIPISIDIKNELLNTATIPPLILQPLIENAIWHGIVPKKVDGKIAIHAMKKGEYTVITIQDNGVGINSNVKSGGNKLALKNIEQRLKLMDGNRLHQYVELINIKNQSDTIIGAKTTLKICTKQL